MAAIEGGVTPTFSQTTLPTNLETSSADTLLASSDSFPQSSGWASDNPHSLFGREFSESITLVDTGTNSDFRAQADITVSKEFGGSVLRVEGESVAGEFRAGDGVPDKINMQEWITVTFDDGRSMDFQIGGEISVDGGGVSIGGGTSWEPVVAGDYKTYSPSNVYQTTSNVAFILY
ncbi:MAG: hypothetical protein AAFU65_03800 [Pseudomonadota bacterium]